MIDPLFSGIFDRFRGLFTGKYTPFGGKAAPCYECSMTLNTKDTKKTGCRKYAGLVDNDTWNVCCIICPFYQQSVTNIVQGPRPGTPLFGSIKHYFQGFSFFLWTSMRTKTIQERFPLRGSYSPKGPAFFIYLNYYLHMTHSFQILIFMIVKD